MSERLFLSHLSVTPYRAEHILKVGWVDRRGIEQLLDSRTDLNLGHIMGCFSMLLKMVQALESNTAPLPTAHIGGPITLESWVITELTIAPWRWCMTMATKKFSYTVTMDADLEHVILAFSGALKFFCFKHGLTTLDDGIVRHRDRAGELGLLTKEDFHA